MSAEASSESIGQRLARARKRRALTQQGLALRSNYSRSHISQVEAGQKVATPAFVAAMANALAVDPAELYGQPYRGQTSRDDRIHAAIPDIRRALFYIDAPPDLEAPPRDVEELAAEVTALRRLSLNARHVQVGARLPALLAELAVQVHLSEQPRAWGLLNAAQAVAVTLARRLGYNDLATVGIQYAALAGASSDDANLPRLAQLSRALLLLTIGSWETGLRLVRQAGHGMDLDTPQALAVYGALQLRAAVLSARGATSGLTTATDAWQHYEHAVEIAQRLPARVPDYYALQFNRANVALHGAAVAVELRDLDEALRRDQALGLPAGALPAERRAHHEIDMARVHTELSDPERAMSRILAAEKIAPQMARYHPSARAVVTHIADQRRALPEPLRGLLSRMHIA